MRQKFSIRIRLLAAAAAALVLATAPARAEEIQLKESAVDRYTVQKGDTLWGIAGKFLKQPWRWPEIWRLNREQIKNPHWIYPGDVIVLDKDAGQWRLRVERPVTKLSPTVRVTPLDAQAIPSIPPGDIEPYLSKPLVTGVAGLAGAAEVVAGRDPRSLRGENDTVYVAGIDPKAGDLWLIYRPGRQLFSPDGSAFLGWEQRYLGTARIERFGEVSTARIASATEEILVGDKLIPPPREQIVNYVPHAPEKPVAGRIIGLARDSIEVGRGAIVVIDKGATSGLDVGSVLAIYRVVAPIQDPRPSTEPDRIWQWLDVTTFYQPERLLNVPDERIALLFVFRVFDNVAYGLVLNTTDPVSLGDQVRNP
jgi:LysM domain